MEVNRKECGSSEARERQEGGMVPASPRSCSMSESCDGLSGALVTSPPEERTIAAITNERVNKMERMRESEDTASESLTEILEGIRLREPTEEEWKKIEKESNVIAATTTDVGEYTYKRIEILSKLWEVLSDKEERENEVIRTANVLEQVWILKEKEKQRQIRQGNEKIKKIEEELQMWKENAKRRRESKRDVGVQVEDRDTQCEQLQGNLTEEINEGSCIELEERIRKVEEKIRNIEAEKRRTEDIRGDKDAETREFAWSQVIGRRERTRLEKRKESKERREGANNAENGEGVRRREEEDGAPIVQTRREWGSSREEKLKELKRRTPKKAGVLLEIKEGSDKRYEEILDRCEQRIDLDKVGIPPVGVRRTRGGGVLLEIGGSRPEEGAQRLARLVRETVGTEEEDIEVRCPLRRLRVRLNGLPVGAAASNIARVIATVGDGNEKSVRIGPVRVSKFGLGFAWADMPARMAIRLLEAEHLRMGWARVGVTIEAEERGPPKCYRCLARGHLRRWCPSEIDRGRCCLGCGEEGHRVGQCNGPARCPICGERGLRADHRPGDAFLCKVVVPPGADRGPIGRSGRPPGGPPPPPDPGEGQAGEKTGRVVPPSAGASNGPADGEAPASRDPEEGSRGEEREVAPEASRRDTSTGPSGRFWGMDISAASSDMEVEEAEVSRKRKVGDGLTDCTVVLDPLPAPKTKGGKSKKKKK